MTEMIKKATYLQRWKESAMQYKMKRVVRDLLDWLVPFQQELNLRGYEGFFKGKKGLEIGGPSYLWRKAIPIYRWAKSIDNYDFSEDAIRHLKGKGKKKFCYFLYKCGDQYAGQADLGRFLPKTYDFVILRDVLEHTANPLKMLFDIHKITKDGGALLVVTPNKLGTFDYARKYTPFRHILQDYLSDTTEDDDIHIQELKDLTHDHCSPAYTSREELHRIIEKNSANRNAHHHVFSLEVLSRCCSEAGYRTVLATESLFPHTIVMALRYPESNINHKPSSESILKYELET